MTEIQTHRFEYPVPENFADFDPEDFIEKAGKWIQELIEEDEKVAISASGGVDSTVAAHLIGRFRKNIYPFFIEDGCRRIIEGEPESKVTQGIFTGFPNFKVLQAETVIPALIDQIDGEAKRKAFIACYKEISDKYIREVGADWIADGTIAPDIRETEGRFKSQHNVGWNYTARKLEPLASLAKPHVRKVAMALGLSEEFAHRIPCPGPAQILRVVGRFNRPKLRASQTATDIVEQMVKAYYQQKFGKPYLYDENTGVRTPFQYFGVVLDSGMEPNRDFTDLAEGILNTGSKGFVMEARTTIVPPGGRRPEKPVNKPVAWLETKDDVGYDELGQLSREAWKQLGLPRILCKVFEGGGPSRYIVGIRAVESAAAAKASPVRFDRAYLHEMGKRIGDETGISPIGYDISQKPPATIEFE